MRKIGYVLILTFVLGMLMLPLAGCSGARLGPRVDAHLGLVTDGAKGIGPTASIGLGEYELGGYAGPFGSPDGDASQPAPAAPATPDPALVQALKDLEAKQAEGAERLRQSSAALEQRLKELDAKVAAGELSPAQAEAIKASERKANETLAAAVQKGDESTKAAREAAAEAATLRKQLDGLNAKLAELEAHKAPPWLPTDLTIPSIVAFAGAWGAYLLRKKGAAGLKATIAALKDGIAAAEARSKQYAAQAIERFDDLPETATAAEVREAVRPAPPTV
jgi:hypothetical protein